MKPDHIDDPIEALRAELERVPPPAGYVARLRQRIDAEAEASPRVSWWRWTLPVVALAVVLLAIAINRPTPQTPVVSTVRIEQPPVAPALPPTPAPSPIAHAPVQGPEGVRRVAVAPPPVIEPMPEIITNQAEVLRSLWARSGRKAILVESSDPPPDPAAEIVVAPIEIAPIVIKPLTNGGTPGNSPIVRPPDRNSSEGRAK